jgi:hypothetical protein
MLIIDKLNIKPTTRAQCGLVGAFYDIHGRKREVFSIPVCIYKKKKYTSMNLYVLSMI